MRIPSISQHIEPENWYHPEDLIPYNSPKPGWFDSQEYPQNPSQSASPQVLAQAQDHLISDKRLIGLLSSEKFRKKPIARILMEVIDKETAKRFVALIAGEQDQAVAGLVARPDIRTIATEGGYFQTFFENLLSSVEKAGYCPTQASFGGNLKLTEILTTEEFEQMFNSALENMNSDLLVFLVHSQQLNTSQLDQVIKLIFENIDKFNSLLVVPKLTESINSNESLKETFKDKVKAFAEDKTTRSSFLVAASQNHAFKNLLLETLNEIISAFKASDTPESSKPYETLEGSINDISNAQDVISTEEENYASEIDRDEKNERIAELLGVNKQLLIKIEATAKENPESLAAKVWRRIQESKL